MPRCAWAPKNFFFFPPSSLDTHTDPQSHSVSAATPAPAPCGAFIPPPPARMTTTVSRGSVPADTVAEPQPVLTPHDTSEAAWNGIASSILMTDLSQSTAYSANVPR